MDVLTLTNYADAPFMTQQMAALEERGVRFETRCVPGAVDDAPHRRTLDYLRFVPEVVRESANGYDLIHVHYGLTAPIALTQRHNPVVLSLWGSDVHGPAKPLSQLCATRCDAVVVMSERMRQTLGRPCHVIPDGVDLETFTPQPQHAAREAVGWSTGVYQILFPYSPERTVKNYPRAKHVVECVDGQLERPVELQTVSGVDHADVATYMNAADALLLTSHSEGSPNAVKEAMACNLPVVSVDVGDVRERLRGVEPSVVATSDAGLITGLRSVLERGERSNGREHAHAVSLERTTEAMLEVYSRVV